jgi:hypothetical protein
MISAGTVTLMRATATPLASIFGSGFLIIVPILAVTVGSLSALAMFGIVVAAYLVGEVIRFNIRHVEPILASGNASRPTAVLEVSSDIALVLAYTISVSLYLRILASFLLGVAGVDTELNESVVASIVIVFIVLMGVSKGLDPVEKLEDWSLGITILIILVVIAAFGIYDVVVSTGPGIIFPPTPNIPAWGVITTLAGTLIVVQGFETSRYLGNSFDSATRIRSSRLSQIASAIVYVVFVLLATPLMHFLQAPMKGNDLIFLAAKVVIFLPALVALSAVLSQFSAAVADTIAGADTISEFTRKKVNARSAYVLIGVAAFILTWTVPTLQLIALASRAFALYYLLQCFVAVSVSKSNLQRVAILGVASALAFVVVFAVPAG